MGTMKGDTGSLDCSSCYEAMTGQRESYLRQGWIFLG